MSKSVKGPPAAGAPVSDQPLGQFATPAQPEREGTDESLRTERQTSDSAVEELRIGAEQADRVVDLARDRADAVLSDARAKEDLDSNEPHVPYVVARDRADADERLQDEHDEADELLRLERADYARTLSLLLPIERASTNRNLLTERARSDKVLAQRDDFLGMVSHDLNNLICGVVLSADYLSGMARDTQEGAEITKGTARILLYSARMKRLVNDLVDITSIDAGKFSVAKVPFDGASLLMEALETVRLLATGKSISLRSVIPTGPVMAPFDRDRILQVLANLISNAIKFSSPGGSVCASLERIPRGIHFWVADSGVGIPEDMLDSVFERFWQVGKNDRRGSGLGLYIAKSIIEAHHGTIWAESRLGEGSTFHFTLPENADMSECQSPY
jgi:signal transduction histidine kinase